MFITVVDNITVNAQPLSPPICDKIAPFFPFHIFVDFRVPLPPLGPDWLFGFAKSCRTSKQETTKRRHPSSKTFRLRLYWLVMFYITLF